MKYFIIAGELSGDKHGASLCRAILARDEQARFEFWGGDEMEKATGTKPLKHIRELAFMGFVQVIRNLNTIRKNFALIKTQITKFQPDCIIYIDYPGFNLRMLSWAHKNGIKNYYYISPTVWAWKQGRKEIIRKFVDKMFVIFPFEKRWYREQGIDVTYVGNPSLEDIKNFKEDPEFVNQYGKENIALLPGSRVQEIELILPVMLEACKLGFKGKKLLIAKPAHLGSDIYKKWIDQYPDLSVSLVENRFYDVLNASEAALVASGTATLETALFGVPQVVCYKTSAINYSIASWLVKLKYISLVNLILNQELVRELIQDKLTAEAASKALSLAIIQQQRTEEGYQALRNSLETEVPPSETMAKYLIDHIFLK